jgi:hypothetical protein
VDSSNFGNGDAPPQVLVGGVSATNVTQVSSTEVHATLSAGNRIDNVLIVLQSAGEVTTTSMRVNYHQCQVSDHVCFQFILTISSQN